MLMYVCISFCGSHSYGARTQIRVVYIYHGIESVCVGGEVGARVSSYQFRLRSTLLALVRLQYAPRSAKVRPLTLTMGKMRNSTC